ncbi:MAG TPA: OmpA family protein [Kofleriaceae bacterium]|nr:OmpA family protein [Kofleriaceae bacterium]
MSWLVILGFVLPSFGPRTIVTSTSIEILAPLRFAPGSTRLPAGADKTLAAIAATLDANPSLLAIAVEAEVTPADGDAFARELVGLRRANAVRDRLVALGVSPSRLVAEVAAGEHRAIEFVVLDRAD